MIESSMSGISLSLEEAQLYKLLSSFFGRELVIPNMSLLAVLGGELPKTLPTGPTWPPDLRKWAKRHRCLFTVIDPQDNPRLVIDFEGIASDHIDVERYDFQTVAAPLLSAGGLKFFRVTTEDFNAMIDPRSNFELFDYLRDQLEQIGFSVPGHGE